MNERSNSFPDAEQIQMAAGILRTVAHPSRLRIIDFLEQGEKSVMEICGHLGSPQPYTSQHLNIMKARGILHSRRNGTHVLYSIANQNVVQIIHCVRQHGGSTADAGGRCAVVVDERIRTQTPEDDDQQAKERMAGQGKRVARPAGQEGSTGGGRKS